MSGVILAVPDRPEVALRVLAAAARLADLTGSGRVNVLSIRTPPLSTIVLSEEVLTAERERRIRTSGCASPGCRPAVDGLSAQKCAVRAL